MQLSIIIVNYNVKFFLEQCLCSVEKAIRNIDSEVWVVDNASKDGSIDHINTLFPFVKCITSNQNLGFAKANNLALKTSSGKYVLFLNPDTIIPEDCLEKCIAFLETHNDAGALGIRMIDGKGDFLPESKRAFPSPVTSLFKLSGLTRLFPKSRIFARYHLGFLDEHKDHEVDVLSGAFLMSRRDLLDEVNGFDETFFMYGEDIDLSYRLQKTGLKNYYFSGRSIIHFKGESTKKGSVNYVKMFYQAMSIFVNKHYGAGRAGAFSFFVQMAIWLRASFTAIFHFILKIGLPLLDTIIILFSFNIVTSAWIRYVREGQGFIPQLVNISLPGFTIVFLFAAMLAGIYDSKYKPFKAFLSALTAIIVMLAVYSLLPEKYRFSRGVILFGGVTASILITIFRWLLLKANVVEVEDETTRQQKTLVIGTPDEYRKVLDVLNKAQLNERVLGRVAANGNKEDAIGTIDQLKTLIETLSIKEVIFCEGYLSYASIIDLLQKLPPGVSAKFHGQKSTSIIGSDSKENSGESISVEGNYNLSTPYNKRMKRIIDAFFALSILATFPLQILLVGPKIINHALLVLMAKRTWIGYSLNHNTLPNLRHGVLTTGGHNRNTNASLTHESLEKIDYWYAKEYKWMDDVKLILKHWTFK